MKSMKFLLAVLLIGMLAGCGGDSLDDTIFLEDALDENLPAYTEWGYNAFGAKYERHYFLVSDDITPCKITYQNGLLTFSLRGVVLARRYEYIKVADMSVSFTFPSEPVANYQNLTILNGKNIDLTNANCEVSIKYAGDTFEAQIKRGNLKFKRVQLLRIDDVVNRTILSGTFELQFFNSNDNVVENLTDGRFDMGIRETDFYSTDDSN